MPRYCKWKGAYKNGKKTREYSSWRAMVDRCTKPRGHHKKYYANVVVCERWLNSFETFLADMGPRPVGTTIDRIDNEGNYEPGNCRWATKAEQNSNMRKNVMIELGCFIGTAIEWSRALRLPAATIYARLERGYSAHEALLTPIVRRSNQHIVQRYDAEAI